jgi:hypothetical protein
MPYMLPTLTLRPYDGISYCATKASKLWHGITGAINSKIKTKPNMSAPETDFEYVEAEEGWSEILPKTHGPEDEFDCAELEDGWNEVLATEAKEVAATPETETSAEKEEALTPKEMTLEETMPKDTTPSEDTVPPAETPPPLPPRPTTSTTATSRAAQAATDAKATFTSSRRRGGGVYGGRRTAPTIQLLG